MIIKVELNEQKRADVVGEIEQALSQIQKERDEENLEEKWENLQKLYEGTIEYEYEPWAGAAKYRIGLLGMHIDISTQKAKSQTLNAKPLILLENENKEIDQAEFQKTIRDREDWIDFILRKKVGIENFIPSVYRQAFIQGTAILKIPYDKRVEYPVIVREYTPAEKAVYAFDSLKIHSEEEREENIARLEAGETISVIIKNIELVRSEGALPYRVPIENFYVRPKIRDIYSQKLIAEKMSKSWLEIMAQKEAGFYDEEAVGKLERKRHEEGTGANYDLYECILLSDFEQKGKYRRYLLTLETNTKEILRMVYYPYIHSKICYVPYYAIPRDDFFYGYSLAEKAKGIDNVVDRLWNNVFNMTDIHTNPPKKIVGNPKIPPDPGPGSLFWLKANDDVTPIQLSPYTHEPFTLLTLGMELEDLVTGVSRGLSGQTTPTDPRAPAAKTAMLMAASNERISDYITELQRSNAELAEQVEKIYWQFLPDKVPYTPIPNALAPDEDVRYIPHGTEIPMNKEVELQLIIQFMQFMSAFPEILQDPTKRQIIISAFIDALGGTIEKHKKELVNVTVNPIFNVLSKLSPEQLKQLENMPLGEVMEQIQELLISGGGVPPPTPSVSAPAPSGELV